jgi:hypothetical protein
MHGRPSSTGGGQTPVAALVMTFFPVHEGRSVWGQKCCELP